MKKRLISILLLVLMVMSLFTGMSVSAYADNTVSSKLYTEYKLAEGDWVAKVCSKLGVNYYDVREAVMLLNNITSEGQFSKLATGKVVKIPVSSAAAAQVVSTLKNVSSTTSPNGTASGSTITGTSSLGSTAPIAYYLISHTMRSGETVLGVCNSLGIDFTDNATQIKNINNIDSWTRVNAGKTILLPSVATPSVGTYCYAVLAHRISSGETAYTICSQNGINYNSNQKLLQNLNPATNLTNIKAGATLYVPVPTVINATNNGGVNNPTTTPKPTATPTPTSTPAPTATPAPQYQLGTELKAAEGTVKFFVDGKAVTTAKQGDKVTVEVTPASGKAVQSVTVKYENGSADLQMNGNTFIMPACNIRVDASVKSGNTITIKSNESAKVATTVNNIKVTSAAKKASVQVISTDPGYAVESLSVYTLKANGDRNAISVNSSKCFSMPGEDVIVDVTLAPVKTYDIATNYCANGSYDLQVNGNSVNKAAKGTKVKVVTQANTGFELESIVVKHGSNILKIQDSSFTMPAGDVSVEVYFISKTNGIKFEAIVGGELAAYSKQSRIAANLIDEAGEGDTVYVSAINVDASTYGELESVSVKSAFNGRSVETKATSTKGMFSFVMPRGGVVISGELEAAEIKVTVEFDPAAEVGNALTLTYEGKTKVIEDKTTDKSFKAHVGSTITLSNTPNAAYAFAGYTVNDNNNLSNLANIEGAFTVPAGDVTIKAKFIANALDIPAATISGPEGSAVSYQVSTNGGAWTSANKCIVNDKVKIVWTSSDDNYSVTKDNIVVTDKAGNQVEVDSSFCFVMPKDGIKSIVVTYLGTDRTIELTSNHINMVQLDGTVYNADAAKAINVVSGNKFSFGLTAAGKAAYSIEKVEVVAGSTSYEATLNSAGNYELTMPNVDGMKVTVTLKPLPVEVKLDGVTNGTVKFYSDAACTKEITDLKKVDVGDVYFKLVANTGYKYKENTLKITDSAAAEVSPASAGTDVWAVTVPEGGLTVKAEFISGTYALKVNFKGNAAKLGQTVLEINGEKKELDQDVNTFYVNYNTSLKISAKSDSGYNFTKILSANTDLLKDVAASSNAASFTMPAGALEIDLELVAK